MLHSSLNEETTKMLHLQVENVRRKQNFLPFIVELFKVLGEAGKLTEVYNEAIRFQVGLSFGY